ncbi:MAG: single-stranded DNA-binding protein [Christensenellaceae bacterium]|jgi:single-stranded DNA-binding protein|nr:single-stranded DNA-binding protein [Christensenellaceae bacterium]
MDKSNISISNNSVFLTGKICKELTYSHEAYSEGFYETELEVLRLSQQTDIIPITISDRLLNDMPIDIGSFISLHGQFRSYNRTVDGSTRLLLTVFVRDYQLSNNPERNPNLIEITGYICKPPIYRETPFKREICDILVAVNRAYNKSDYIPCIAWGRSARYTSTLPIGSRVTISGRIQSREYQKQFSDGTTIKRIAYEISVSRISLLDSNINCQNFPQRNSQTHYGDFYDEGQPNNYLDTECCADETDANNSEDSNTTNSEDD